MKEKESYHSGLKARETLKKIDDALDTNAKSKILTTDVIDKVPDELQEAIQQEVIFAPNPGPQTEFLAAGEDEVFYGGARGGGKSFAMLVDPLRYCNFPEHRAVLIRKTMPELRDLIYHSKQLYPKAYPGAKFFEQEKEWRFKSGARIEFGYAENLADALRYQGQAYSWAGIDELPQYSSPEIVNILRGSLRSVNPDLPVYFRATGNPGNIGSHWVKELYIDPATPGQAFKVRVDTPLGPRFITRRFIQAKLKDNPFLMKNDQYMVFLSSLPEILRKQWLDGDWDIRENNAFPEFHRYIHTVEPFGIPRNWPRFRSADWGYSSPACVLWFACDYNGTLYVYRELYTKGLTADKFAMKVMELEANDPKPMRGIMDSSIWSKRGDIGPSVPDTMAKQGCMWRPSDRSPNSRRAGKMEIHRRLAINELTKKPKLLIFNTCLNTIRTLPELPLDRDDPEDVDTKAEDHAYDALRYGCMSRPMSMLENIMFQSSQLNSYTPPANRTFGY